MSTSKIGSRLKPKIQNGIKIKLSLGDYYGIVLKYNTKININECVKVDPHHAYLNKIRGLTIILMSQYL